MSKARFEDAPYRRPPDETDVNLRAYFDSLSDEKLSRVKLNWNDEQLREWDGNFRDDGLLMLVCCDRDVEIREFRDVLSEFMKFRKALEALAEENSTSRLANLRE